jgi:hypothetical protein
MVLAGIAVVSRAREPQVLDSDDITQALAAAPAAVAKGASVVQMDADGKMPESHFRPHSQ